MFLLIKGLLVRFENDRRVFLLGNTADENTSPRCLVEDSGILIFWDGNADTENQGSIAGCFQVIREEC